jgi:hypothetical protein
MLSIVASNSQADAQTVTSIIITTIVAAAITGLSIFVNSRGKRKRHLTIQRTLQSEVKKQSKHISYFGYNRSIFHISGSNFSSGGFH